LGQYTILDYDLRHVFGFPKKAEDVTELRKIYQTFLYWKEWCSTIRSKLSDLKSKRDDWFPPEGYHASLGICENKLLILHRIDTIPGISNRLKFLGAQEAVLLDSGGSCAIWVNWINANHGGVLAHNWNFRAARGAVVFLVVKGDRNISVL
jgi:hypothetical protein